MSELQDETRRALEEQAKNAAQRYDQTEGERQDLLAERNAGVGVKDTMEQLEARAGRLVQLGETPLEAVVSVALADAPDRMAAYERIIGATKDLQAASFLPRGARAAKCIGRISEVDGGRQVPLGTGFLVSERLLMTNNHVLPDVTAAERVVVEFGAEVDIDNVPSAPVRYLLDPDMFFVSDEHLDISLVLVQPDSHGNPAGKPFGWLLLIRQQGKIVIGESVNVIGHPMGRFKEISIRNNSLDLQLDHFLHYSTDTEPGNSGSPVFNDQWEVVALHHAGVSKKDDQGNVLRKDGQVWRRGDGDDAIDWVGNEGARVSVILDFLAHLDLDQPKRRILDELGPGAQVQATSPEAQVAGTSPAAPETITAPHALEPIADAPAVPLQRSGEPIVRRGIAGSGGNGPHLVFLHGRSQQGRDPQRLRGTWAAGLNAGMTRASMPGIEPGSVWFPYYGDRLVQAVSALETLAGAADSGVEPAEALAPAPGDPVRTVYEELLSVAAAHAGMPADLEATHTGKPDEGMAGIGATIVSRLQRHLRWLAARSRLDEVTIALLFRDVAAYLGRPGVRAEVLTAVADTLPDDGPIVLVSHSLGTVVAMDLVAGVRHLDVSLLVTAGSPLGMDAVHRRLTARELRRPATVQRWVNVWCPGDAVAIGCPLRPTWGDGLNEIVTNNANDRVHDITEYLGDPAVAAVIGAALTPAAALA